MSVKNVQKVISLAATYLKFRMALRKSPKEALTEFAAKLQLSKEGCTESELKAVLAFNDDDYGSFEKLIGTLDGDLKEGDRTSLKIS